MSRLPRVFTELLRLAAVSGFLAFVLVVMAIIDPSSLPA